jgi:site-specific recombinase XerC
MLDAPVGVKQTHQLLAIRDRAILELLYHTPLKLYQIPLLKKNDFMVATGQLRSPKKNGQLFKLSLHTQNTLRSYLGARSDAEPALFIAHDRSQTNKKRISLLSTRSIQRMVAKYSKTSSPTERITPRVLQKNRLREAD